MAYVASLGDGPALPEVDLEGADLAAGGLVYRANCQACHSASGGGGALSYGRAAPELGKAEPSQVAEAVRIGPGQMPVFGEAEITPAQLDDLVAYVEYLQEPEDPGGLPIGRIGPVPEGFVAWFVGSAPRSWPACIWIGTRSPCLTNGRPLHDPRPNPRPPWLRADGATASGCRVLLRGASWPAIGLAVVYWQGGQTQLEGVLLAVAAGGIGVGIVVWAKRFMPDGPEVTRSASRLDVHRGGHRRVQGRLRRTASTSSSGRACSPS